MSLAKRHALVTGSTSGIGLAIARALASAGADVMINGMGDAAAIEAERAKIEKDFDVKAFYNGADMTKPAEIAAMVADAQSKFGSLDILVNNAGIQFVSPIEDFPLGEVGRDHRDQSLRRLPRHARRGSRHEGSEMGPHRLDGVSAHSLVASPFKSAYVSAKHGLPA